MRLRLTLLLALLAIAVLFTAQLLWMRSQAGPPETVVTAAPTAEPDRRIDFTGATTQAELEALLEASYRLPPDRRMTVALGQLSDLLRLTPTVPDVHAEWALDRWSITVGGAPAGALAALPGFADGLALAEAWARGSGAIERLPAGAPEGIATAFLRDAMPEQALAHLDDVARRSGTSVALMEQALVACTQLSLILREDKSGYADTTMARALALLALVRVAGRDPHVREQCGLAWSMGYTEEAAKLARALPESDVLRLLVLRQDDRLAEAVRREPRSREARLGLLLALARAGDLAGWMAAVRSAVEPPSREVLAALSTALAFRRFDAGREIGPTLLHASLRYLPDAPRTPEADSTTIDVFERALSHAEVSRRGPLAGGAVASARRALFYSGLFAIHHHLHHQLASPRALEDWSRELSADPRAQGAWFARWQRNVARAASGETVTTTLFADLDAPDLPAAFAQVTFEVLLERRPADDPTARAAARALARRLDTRPGAALAFAEIVQKSVHWPVLTERLVTHAVTCAGRESASATLTLAMMRDDRAGLSRIVDDPSTDPILAMRALRVWLAADSSASEALLPRYAALAARRPADWDLVDAHADLLEARGRFGEAERVLSSWLEHADSTQDDLDEVLARTALARVQRKQGNLERALRSLGDADESMQRGAMMEKARLLALMGELDAALALAKRAHERYPQSEAAQVFPIELYWRTGQLGPAAELLAQLSTGDADDMGQVASDFANVFGTDHAAAEQALAAVRTAVPAYPRLLWWIVREYRIAGQMDFAARLAEHAHPGSGIDRGFGVANTYQLLHRARGETSANTWLARQKMDPAALELVSGLLTTGGHPQTAWELESAAADDEYVWTMRAAAWRMHGERRRDWADTLRAHWQSPGTGLYRQLTGYLLGEVSEPEILQLADSPKHRVEVWYHCALAAWNEGRARDAMLWMVLCQETGSNQDGEYIWSHCTVTEWSQAWRTLDRLRIGARARA